MRSHLAALALGFLTIATFACGGGMISAQESQDVIENEPADSEAQIMVAEPDGSKMRMLTILKDYVFQGSPEWSADGKLVAFDCRFKGRTNNAGSFIGVVNADGTNPRVLGEGMMPSLSPKGNKIAFSNQIKSGVWVQTISDPNSVPVLLESRGWGTSWSPDGTKIAYGSFSPPNLWVYDVVEGTKTPLFTEQNIPYQQIRWNFCWSPDSKQIAFNALKKDGGAHVLGIIDARGFDFGHKVRFERTMYPTMAWSPDGKQIVFSMDSPERNGIRQMYFVDPTTQDPPQLLLQQAANRKLEDPCFLPDGKIAVSAYRPVAK